MKRIFLKQLSENLQRYEIYTENREFHHMRNVLRCKIGEKFELFNGKRLTGIGCITAISTKKIIMEIERYKKHNKKISKLNIAVSIVKPNPFNIILNSLTQLGVYKIFPFVSDFSYIQNFSDKKLEKWNNILIDAAKQSRNNNLTFINKIYTIDEIIDFNFPLKILFNNKSKKTICNIENLIKLNNEKLITIGPEGGFSDSELTRFTNKNFIDIKLNSYVLRSETSAITAVSIIKYISGEL